MKTEIKENLNNPEKLEKLYNADKKSFESDFEEIWSAADHSELLKFWKIRLDFEKTQGRLKGTRSSEIIILVATCIISGFLIKIPDVFKINISDSDFYERNIGIITFFGLTIYFVLINKILRKNFLALILITFLVSAVYINLLPSGKESDSIDLVCLHMPLLLWFIFGLVFIDNNIKNKLRRIDYIKYNGDLAIMSAIILIAGGILTGLTIGLFNAIGINIEKFYMENIVITGLVCVPIVATFIMANYLTMSNKIAPVIANFFSPFVLLTAIIYLVAIAVSGKDPYNDRDFLLIFNIMLLGVMAIVVFSVSENSPTRKQRFNEMILFILLIITVIIDIIALSAIFYRLGTFGLTPNRLAVLGSNLLILANLVLIIIDFYKINFRKKGFEEAGTTIAKFLPVYLIWILIVIFGFPLIFGMK
jgi:hypothetical protein